MPALSLHSRDIGASTRSTVVLLAPIGLDGRAWEPIAQRLAQRHRVLSVDLRGHGRSERPASAFALEDMAVDMASWLSTIGEPPPVLVGCSLGGMVALGTALHAPQLVGGLVLADCNASQTTGAREVMRQRATAAMTGMIAVVPSTLERWFSPSFRQAHPDVVAQFGQWLLAADPEVHSWCWDAIGALNYGDQLPSIQLPTLVACGSRDVSCPPDVARSMAAAIRGARYVEIEGAGHLAPFEMPHRFADLVDGFAASASGASRCGVGSGASRSMKRPSRNLTERP